MASYKPTEGMKEEAERGLEWRREFGRGGTAVGVARARDIINGRELSERTVKRMFSYFSRHEVDKQGEGFTQGEDGYPSAGRIAWALWGGDAGFTWSRAIVERLKKEEERAAPDALEVGDFVSWDSSGGRARGRIERIERDGEINVPDSDFTITGTPDDPAALIKLFRGGEETDRFVAHKFSTLRKIGDIREYEEYRPYPNEHAARINDPDKYGEFRRETDAGGAGIDFIYGLTDNSSEIQSIRFDSELFTVDEAMDWLEENEFEPIKFEPAIGEDMTEKTTEERHIVGIEETADEIVVTFAKEHDEEPADDEAEEEREMAEEETMEAARELMKEHKDTLSKLHDDDDAMRFAAKEMHHRSNDIEKGAIDIDSRRANLIVSTEQPVERSFGKEILDHSEKSIDLSFLNSGRAPLLLDHDPKQPIGKVENVTLDGSARVLRATVRFGRNGLAKEVFDDVTDFGADGIGIRSNISVGYAVNKMERDGEDSYRVNSWTPMEVSLVSIPADVKAGLLRSQEVSAEPQPETIKDEEMKMSDIEIKEVAAEASSARDKEVAKILELGAKHQRSDLATKAVAEHKSLDAFRGELLEVIGDKPLENEEVGLTKKEVRHFSVLRAIRAMANPTDRQAQEEARFEIEVSEAAQRATGRTARGIMLPSDVLRSWAQRDINTTDDAGLIAEDFRGGDFVDVLRNASSVMQAGATVLNGLQGSVAIPKKTAASTAGWIATEGNASSESEATFGQILMSPKVVGSHTQITRLMMQQSSLDIENLIRNDLAQGISLAIDAGALEGSGSSGQPTGIKNTSGINAPTAFAAANPTFAEVVAMETAVAEDNALLGNLAYILPASMYGALKTTTKDSGSGQFVVEPDGNINGYNAIVSNQVTAGDLYFGNFADALIGLYGGLDIVVDPYSNSTGGTVNVTALQTVDVAVRHAVSFAVNNDGA